MFARNPARKEREVATARHVFTGWNAAAGRPVWIQSALEALQELEGMGRIAVWLEPEPGTEDTASPVVFRGEVREGEGGEAPVEWTRLSARAPLPHELLNRGKSVECRPAELDDGPILGILLGLERALWVPVNGRKLLRGLILVGTREKHRVLPQARVERVAAELALLLEYEDERRISRLREADLALWRKLQVELTSGQNPQTLLKELVENCVKGQEEGGVGAVFALLGRRQSDLPVTRPAEASGEERLVILAQCGDPAWAHSLEQGPLEILWRQAVEAGQVVGAESEHLPLAKEISRIMAIPVEVGDKKQGLLIAGVPRRHDALAILERLEWRALLGARVMEVQQRAEAGLRAKSWQEALLESSAETVLIIDRHGFLLGMSRGAKRLLREACNSPSESAEAKRFAELFRPREWESVNRWVRREFDEGRAEPPQPPEAELSSGVSVRIRRLELSEDKFLAVELEAARPSAAARDVKQVEAELRQSLEWLQEGVVIFDEEGGIRAMNSRSRQILGLAAESVATVRNLDELIERVSRNAAEPESFVANWRALAAQEARESREELAMDWPVPQMIERFSRPIVDEAGRTLGRVEVYQELTARKIFQSRMLQTEKMASLGQRATGIVHELANPLTTILGNAQRLLLRDPTAASNPEVLRILEEAERASTILRQLLYLSRETQPFRGQIFLRELVERTVELQRAGMAGSQIELQIDCEERLPPVEGDFPQLQQVLLNLLQNAQQAIEQSGKGSLIRVRTEHAGERHVRLEVWDDGPGISTAVQGRIYDPFFTTKPVGVGTGLGLSIALGFVRQHGGTLTHLSPKGGGSRFIVEFPVAMGIDVREPHRGTSDAKLPRVPIRAKQELEISPKPVAGNAPRVLVVEDEPTVAALIADVLRDEGMRVDVLLESPSALQQVARESYDLLICDLKMPGMDGQKFYHSLLELHYPLKGKVLFVTGDSAAPRSQEFLTRNHLPHVAKPFRMEELIHAVQELLPAGQAAGSARAEMTTKHVSGNGGPCEKGN